MEILMTSEPPDFGFEMLRFVGHVFGTCAVLYVLFFCKVIGAGDVKLMAVCVGILGIERGAQMIVCGLVLTLLVESFRANIWKCGYLGLKGIKVRLAPYLLFGYCFWILLYS